MNRVERALLGGLLRLSGRVSGALTAAYTSHLAEPLRADRKRDASPVTEADRVAHELLQQGLQNLEPGLPVLSEEAVPAGSLRGWDDFWMVDPLDGTREFLAGSPQFCFNVALIQGGRAVLGLIAIPLLGEVYVGGREFPAVVVRRGGITPLVAQPAVRQSWLKLLVSRRGFTHAGLRQLGQCWRPQFSGVLVEVRGSAWKFCRIAEGAGHCYPCFGETSEWDTAAGQALLEAVGGQVVDGKGRPLRYNQRPSLINPPFFALSPARFDWQSLLDALT